MRRIVYIASPYTQGDKPALVKVQINAFHILMDKGYHPIAPLLAHFLNPRPYEDWLRYDMETISYCDILIRIREKDNFGVEIPSSGADRETAEALRLGLEYYEFESLEDLEKNFK